MKPLVRVSVFAGIFLLITACGSSVTATPMLVLSPNVTATVTSTLTPVPSPTATATIEPVTTQAYIYPTLVPTIDSTSLPELLSNAFSIQKLRGVNGHPIRQIKGWDYGFGGENWYANRCPGYVWMDANHLLLYPRAGQETEAIQGWERAVNLSLGF